MQGVNLPLHWLFFPSSRRHYCASGSVTWTAVSLVYLCTDAVYFIGQYRGKSKWAVYTFYSLCVSSAVFTIRGEPVKAGLRKEMSGKNGAVITQNYTARDDFRLYTHEDLKIRVFVRMILKSIAFLTKLIA